MAESTNRIHVSPGVYMSETVDMKAAANSLGVTKLAVVGETLKGPAFQPYWITSQKEFSSVFGGTSAKKFIGSKYPKYELPYIAKDYLTKSKKLCVVRTLGFSGYNAGPAWMITGSKDGEDEKVIAVLRSRGTYKYRPEYATSDKNNCQCQSAFDSITYDVGERGEVVACNSPKSYNMDAVCLSQYISMSSNNTCDEYSLSVGKDSTKEYFDVSYGNLGRFTIKCIVGASNEKVSDIINENKEAEYGVVSIPVSLNPSDKDYILNVLGSSNDDGDQPLFVESLYDVAWKDLVSQGYDRISKELATYNVGFVADYNGIDAVNGLLSKHEEELTKKDLGKRVLYGKAYSPENIKCHLFEYSTDEHTDSIEDCKEGHIYTVAMYTDKNGKKHYVYKAYSNSSMTGLTEDDKIRVEDRLRTEHETSESNRRGSIVYNYSDGLYYKLAAIGERKVRDGEASKEVGDVTFSKAKTGFTINVAKTVVTGTGSTEESEESGKEFALVIADKTYVFNLFDADASSVSQDAKQIEKNVDGSWTVIQGKKYRLEIADGNTPMDNYEIHYKIFETGDDGANSELKQITCDVNNYKSAYRYSSTPWVVSNAKGDGKKIELNRMFRFHTISDGSNSLNEVKVSIENIRPDLGQFDVVVRSYDDSDASSVVLERFSRCTMSHGKKYIGYMIGTIDGQYESKSKYMTVEVMDSGSAENSVPCGFLGYPIPRYDGETIAGGNKVKASMADIRYNLNYDEDKPMRKQYFGISDITGYDYDYFSFKGNMATLEDPNYVSHGFHLDCRVSKESYSGKEGMPSISVDGESGYVFDSVSVNARTSNMTNMPIITTEDGMVGSIYEDVKLRKFTMVFAQGFDGWDIYREQRSNTDDFSCANYKGYINKNDGVGYSFDTLTTENEIEGAAITSDYYSTLAGVSLLKNPEEVDINLLATPGIDMVNNTKLVSEIFDILEDRADTLYIVTTPDKELGAGDYADEMQTVDETVFSVTYSGLHSGYAATYYPWVKIEDNGEYLYIPATRDVVRNMAESDNSNTTMNLAPAGLTRGRVNAIRARKNLKIAESDELYEASINPVRTYAHEGLVIMGQKTLRETDDLLSRIDVRRCVLRMRKLIAIGTLGLIFEPNDSSTVKSFRSIISGIMSGFVANRAISNWHMDVDESEEARDRLEINATIYIKPIRALEYIGINFVVTNKGVYFED